MNKEINYKDELRKLDISLWEYQYDYPNNPTCISLGAEFENEHKELYNIITGQDAWHELWAMPETQGKRYYDFTMTEDGEFEIEVAIWAAATPEIPHTAMGRGMTPREAIRAVIKEIIAKIEELDQRTKAGEFDHLLGGKQNEIPGDNNQPRH